MIHYLIFATSVDGSTALLLKMERSKMINTAISSAHRHGIKLKPGTPNPGAGDCAFEAIIQNNNDRSCFTDKLKLTSTGIYGQQT